MKKRQAVLTGPCLRPVMDHRTRPVPIPEDLDLSGIDRTLRGSVRSLPPERPVSGSRAALGLFLVSFSVAFLGNYLTAAVPCSSSTCRLPEPELPPPLLAAAAKRAAVLLPRRAAPLRPSLPARSHASTARTSLARARPASLLAARHQGSLRHRVSPSARASGLLGSSSFIVP